MISTHRLIQLADLDDKLTAKSRVYRRCSLKAANIGNRNAATYFLHSALKMDAVVMRIRNRLGAAALAA